MSLPSQILLMSEVVGQSDLPLWAFSDGRMGGGFVGDDLEISRDLHDRINAWNIECVDREDEHGFRTGVWPLELSVRSFDLIADLQNELGDECVVWCGGGGPLGRLERDYLSRPTDSIVLLTASGERDVFEWFRDDEGIIDVRRRGLADMNASRDLVTDVAMWRGPINRFVDHPGAEGVPTGAAVRAAGARLAGRLQAELGSHAHVFYFGGGGSTIDANDVFWSLRAAMARDETAGRKMDWYIARPKVRVLFEIAAESPLWTDPPEFDVDAVLSPSLRRDIAAWNELWQNEFDSGERNRWRSESARQVWESDARLIGPRLRKELAGIAEIDFSPHKH